MSIFGWGVGDIATITTLAVKVYTAYKDAPDSYKHISQEVKSLQILINKAVPHVEKTTLSDNCRQEGQEALKGCQSILEDLHSLIEKYKDLTATNRSQVFQKVKLGTEDIATLRSRLISNTGLLNGFIQRSNIPSLTINIYYANISSSAVSCKRCVRCRLGWLMLLVYNAQLQEFH